MRSVLKGTPSQLQSQRRVDRAMFLSLYSTNLSRPICYLSAQVLMVCLVTLYKFSLECITCWRRRLDNLTTICSPLFYWRFITYSKSFSSSVASLLIPICSQDRPDWNFCCPPCECWRRVWTSSRSYYAPSVFFCEHFTSFFDIHIAPSSACNIWEWFPAVDSVSTFSSRICFSATVVTFSVPSKGSLSAKRFFALSDSLPLAWSASRAPTPIWWTSFSRTSASVSCPSEVSFSTAQSDHRSVFSDCSYCTYFWKATGSTSFIRPWQGTLARPRTLKSDLTWYWESNRFDGTTNWLAEHFLNLYRFQNRIWITSFLWWASSCKYRHTIITSHATPVVGNPFSLRCIENSTILSLSSFSRCNDSSKLLSFLPRSQYFTTFANSSKHAGIAMLTAAINRMTFITFSVSQVALHYPSRPSAPNCLSILYQLHVTKVVTEAKHRVNFATVHGLPSFPHQTWSWQQTTSKP